MLTPHPGEETLEEYLMGRIPESQVAKVEEHLLLCDYCRSFYILIEERIRDIRAGLKVTNEHPHYSRRGH
jgi:predicted anti-sigma-YlaC factor YlaD